MGHGRGDDRLYPNRGEEGGDRAVSRRNLLRGSATAGAALTAGCGGGSGDGATPTDPSDGEATTVGPTDSGAVEGAFVFVFNTGDGTVSVIDAESDAVVGSRHPDLTATFPSNQFAPDSTTDPGDPLWLNVEDEVRALEAGTFAEVARRETGSGANWQEVTPGGRHLVVSAREPSHANYRIDADPDSASFGDITAELDRSDEAGRGSTDGPGPCDVTVHPEGEYAYVPDLFGDSLTVLDVERFSIETQIDVDPVGDDPAAPWMATASWDGERLLVEHDEGSTGTESVWDVSDPANPQQVARLTRDDGLGAGPITSEIGPDSETGYVFTPGTSDVTVVNLASGNVRERVDLGGEAFAGTWGPSREKLYVPIQTTDEVAVVDHAAGDIVERIDVGASPYGATAARVRPPVSEPSELRRALATLGADVSPADTSYCIGNCACGHRLDDA